MLLVPEEPALNFYFLCVSLIWVQSHRGKYLTCSHSQGWQTIALNTERFHCTKG